MFGLAFPGSPVMPPEFAFFNTTQAFFSAMSADLWDTLSAAWSVLVTISPVVSAIALVLAATGGVPEIRRFMSPRPRLKVTIGGVTRTSQPMGYAVRVTVLNEKKRFRRTTDAENVVASVHIMGSTHQDWGAAYNIIMSPYLMSGLSITKDLQHGHNFVTAQEYTIVVLVGCNQLDYKVRANTTYVSP